MALTELRCIQDARPAAWELLPIVADLDTVTALSAADLCARHKLATADAIVHATALAHGADLLTCDRHFENLPGVRFIAKSGG